MKYADFADLMDWTIYDIARAHVPMVWLVTFEDRRFFVRGFPAEERRSTQVY